MLHWCPIYEQVRTVTETYRGKTEKVGWKKLVEKVVGGRVIKALGTVEIATLRIVSILTVTVVTNQQLIYQPT